MQETWVWSLGREIPWKSKWQPTPGLLPGKSHGQRSLVGYSPWGHKEWDTTEWLHFTSLHFISPPLFSKSLHDRTPFFPKQNRLKLLQVNTTALSPKLIYRFHVLDSFVSLVLLLFLCSSLVNWLVYLSVALQFASQLLTITRGKLASTYLAPIKWHMLSKYFLLS